jgi:hypothetical protein
VKTSTAIGYFLTSIIVFLTPVAPLMVVIALAILIDTFLGLYKALFYELLIIILYPIDVYIMGGSIYGIEHLLTKAGVVLLVFIEALSVDENIRAINKNRGFEFYFNKLLTVIKKGKATFTDIKKCRTWRTFRRSLSNSWKAFSNRNRRKLVL